MKHYTIPIFIPELACPNRCIYCNQRVISSQLSIPHEKEIIKTIEEHLQSFKPNARVQIGFFGGNFTGIPKVQQEILLKLAKPYLQNRQIEAIRLSTRPDYITEENLEMLKGYGVKEIELGVQSMNAEVLQTCDRGYSPEKVEHSAKLIKDFGFDLGMQMMLGLPADTKQRAADTARKIVELGASSTRIYPTLVIEDTQLANLYKEGKYYPLSLEEAVDWAKEAYLIFKNSEVKILRMGLHPTKDFLEGKGYLAGPFHVSFKELVQTAVWTDKLEYLCKENKTKSLKLTVNSKELNAAVGYHAKNKKRLQTYYQNVLFCTEESIPQKEWKVEWV